MEMEVVMPAVVSTMDFNFDSNCTSPYMTAPSSPQRFGSSFFFSAPASPTRISAVYRELNNDHSLSASNTCSKVFHINDHEGNEEEKDQEEEDFEFNFSGQFERTSMSADQLFDGGKIRPLKPPTGYAYESAHDHVQQRGRERVSDSCSSKRGNRSLSPLRVSDIRVHEDKEGDNSQAARIIINSKRSNNNNINDSKSYASSILSAISFTNRKWKLKDLWLFRSASEGRAKSPDPLEKYDVLSKKEALLIDDVKNSSFRSTDSSGSVSRRKRAPVSAHELHYTTNRAVSEELKRKTFLPYKQGLLGCLGFDPSGVHDISRTVGSLPRG